jgi:hypothetical protein
MEKESPEPLPKQEPSSPKSRVPRRLRTDGLSDVLSRNRAALNLLGDSPGLKAQIAALNQLTDSPATKAMLESIAGLKESPAMRAMTESMEHLNLMSKRPAMDIRIPELSPKLAKLGPPPQVALLQAVHSQLKGMADVLSESAQQTAEMVAATKANLTAVQAVVEELRESRRAADRWNRTIAILTVALLAATAVAAVAVVPDFIRQIVAAWSWLQSLT